MTHTIPTRQPTLPPVVAMPGSVDGSTLEVVRVYCPEVQAVVLIDGITYPHFTVRRTRQPSGPGLAQIKEWEAIHGPLEEDPTPTYDDPWDEDSLYR